MNFYFYFVNHAFYINYKYSLYFCSLTLARLHALFRFKHSFYLLCKPTILYFQPFMSFCNLQLSHYSNLLFRYILSS